MKYLHIDGFFKKKCGGLLNNKEMEQILQELKTLASKFGSDFAGNLYPTNDPNFYRSRTWLKT